jgi:hypothetical protein
MSRGIKRIFLGFGLSNYFMLTTAGNHRSKRIIQVFVVAIGITATLAMYKSIQSVPDKNTALEAAREELKRGLVILAPNDLTAPIGEQLVAGDEFNRQLQASVTDVSSGGRGGELYALVRQFVHKSDVLAKHVMSAREYDGGYNIFAGHRYDSGWDESIEWCLRLRYAPGQESAFAYGLWKLGRDPFIKKLGLPYLINTPITLENSLQYIDPKLWQGVLIPMTTYWHGEGEYKLHAPHRVWYIEWASNICDAARASVQH